MWFYTLTDSNYKKRKALPGIEWGDRLKGVGSGVSKMNQAGRAGGKRMLIGLLVLSVPLLPEAKPQPMERTWLAAWGEGWARPGG